MKRKHEEAVLPGVTKKVKGDPSENTEKLREEYEAVWRRPPLRHIDTEVDDLVFQQMDIDYDMEPAIEGMPGNQEGKVPVIRMFGVTESGNSVCLLVHGVVPYFFVEEPAKYKGPNGCVQFRHTLNEAMRLRASKQYNYENFVVDVEKIEGQSIMGFSGDKKVPMYRIGMAAPMIVPVARACCEEGDVGGVKMQTYESNIQFALRYMIDAELVGASWIKCAAGTYSIVDKLDQKSRCQIEAIIAVDKVINLGAEGDWGKLAPLRTLSFDIECCSASKAFPEPDRPHDYVISIASYVTVQGSSEPLVKSVFTLRGCSSIVGAQVLSFDTEKDMLVEWAEFIQILDPDIITGYNIANFDFWYLISRARYLKANQFCYLSRIKSDMAKIKTDVFQSKMYGTRESKNANLPGRVQLDMFQIMQRDHKLRSYSLNSVAAHFLGQQKEDVQYSIITDLFNGTNEDRRRLAVYCLKDAQLPILLMEKLMVIVNYLEMARVTGVPVSYLLARGQQIKVLSQLYRKAKEKGLMIPTVKVQKPAGDEVAYAGAVVIPPKTGFYDKPISTLDFASLYPSIMMAHNLCYSTLLNPNDVVNFKPEDYILTPSGDYFVKPHIRVGILPAILVELIAARGKAKKALELETDEFKIAVQNGRQLALKVSANSVYGFTGAVKGKLPCIAISASVTSYGRDMIDKTKSLVEEKYTISNGYEFDSVVIYGDTDSVMVRFGTDSVEEAMRLGREAAAYVTTFFIRPINLTFEKVYFPYLLMTKKRYAGLLWTKPDRYSYMDAKGIVTVRRDNCALVREVIDTCLHKILIDRNPKDAEEFAKKMIADLLQNKIDLSLLVITKALSKNEYKNKQAHVELTNRMHKRDPGTAPNIGDRVQYVIVKGTKDARAYEKAEDPLWVLEHDIALDNQWYLDHQLSKPLKAIFTPILKSVTSLLKGEHTFKTDTSASASNPLAAFVQKQVRCMNCRVLIPASQKNCSLCVHCQGLNIEAQIYQDKLGAVNELELKFSRLWTQCQSCQGSFHQPVLCTSRDCPIFYMRKKVQKDLGDAQQNLARFQIDW